MNKHQCLPGATEGKPLEEFRALLREVHMARPAALTVADHESLVLAIEVARFESA